MPLLVVLWVLAGCVSSREGEYQRERARAVQDQQLLMSAERDFERAQSLLSRAQKQNAATRSSFDQVRSQYEIENSPLSLQLGALKPIDAGVETLDSVGVLVRLRVTQTQILYPLALFIEGAASSGKGGVPFFGGIGAELAVPILLPFIVRGSKAIHYGATGTDASGQTISYKRDYWGLQLGWASLPVSVQANLVTAPPELGGTIPASGRYLEVGLLFAVATWGPFKNSAR